MRSKIPTINNDENLLTRRVIANILEFSLLNIRVVINTNIGIECVRLSIGHNKLHNVMCTL